MKTILNWMRLGLCLAAVLPASGAVPFSDGFDDSAYYGPGTNFLTPIRGWTAGSADVAVTAEAWDSAPHSARIVGPAELSNTVGAAAGQVVWTDLRVRPVFGGPPSLGSNGTASVAGYFSSNRRFAIMPAGVPLECTTTVWGAATSLLPTGEFARITIYQNYATSNSAVFVNSNLVAQDVAFYGTRPTYGRFLVRGGYTGSTQYLDTVSFSNGPPADMTTDLNGDGLPDVNELALYGYAMRFFVVASNAVYTNIQAAVNVVRPRDCIVVSNGTYAGNVTVDRTVGGLTGGVFTVGGTFTLGTSQSLTSRVGFAASSLVVSNAAALTVYGNVSASNVNVCTTAWLAVSGMLRASNVVVAGALNLSAGGGIVCTNLTVGQNALVVLTSGTFNAGHLSISTGGRLVVSNGTVSADGLLLTGSFTLDERWGNSQAQSSVPFADGFEDYQAGTTINALGFRGWGTSSTNAQVQSQSWAVGSNLTLAPGLATISNRVNGAGQSNVWTDLRIRPRLGSIPLNMPTSSCTCLFVFDTNGYVVVYNPTNGWETCSSNAEGTAVTNRVSAATWARLTVYANFMTRQSAVLLDGELLRERLPFGPGAATSYRRLVVDNRGSASAYLDEVAITATRPMDLDRDIDSDGGNDLDEIARYGTLHYRDPGSVYTFR